MNSGLKAILEAAIAIVIVYLFLEYFKKQQGVSSSANGGGSVATGATAAMPLSGCCCGGGGTAAGMAPAQNPIPGWNGVYNPVGINFNPEPIYVSTSQPSVPPSPAPVPRFNEQINA